MEITGITIYTKHPVPNSSFYRIARTTIGPDIDQLISMCKADKCNSDNVKEFIASRVKESDFGAETFGTC